MSSAYAQTTTEAPVAPNLGDGNTRLAVGYDSQYKLRGEILQHLAGDDRSVWLGEGWVGSKTGGIQLDRHWFPDENGPVWKLFAAWDRNKWNDQKVSVGGGAESESWFWGAYGSKGITGDRDLGAFTTEVVDTRRGNDAALGDYLQDVTTSTTVRTFERAYDYGVGARLGKVFGSTLIRVVGGLDYEWHKSATSLSTVSIGVEKFFLNSPHSVLVTAAVSDRRGDSDTGQNDQRIGMYWRYQFGGISKIAAHSQSLPPVEPTVPAPVVQPIEPPAPVTEQKVLHFTESVAAETFFDLNRVALKTDAFEILDRLAGRLKNASLEGTIKIVGHTCNLGPAAYNKKLSLLRASAVRDYLITTGAVPADRVMAIGMGEDDPRYPNTRSERQKNRRCDVEFSVIDDKTETVAIVTPPKAETPTTERPVATEPQHSDPWWQRALRNPVTHKREVDTYTRRETTTTVVDGTRQYLNRAPTAVDDHFDRLGSRMPVTLNVLANDTDPDGDVLRVVSVTDGSNGTVTIQADNTLRYIWHIPHEGVDSFTYTVVDSKGALSTARVVLNVIDP